MIISKCWCWSWLVTAFNSSSVSGIIFFLGNLLMLKRGGFCSLFAALFTKLNLRRSPSSLRASACCLSLINVGSRVGVPIVQGEVKGLKEFDQLITEESKLKKSHSAISFILKLCKVSSLFIFSSFPIGSSVMRWALLGGLCSTGGSRGGGLGGCVLVGWGVGARGWRRHPPPQTPATPPSPCEVPPNRSSANSSPPLAICHQQKCCSDASKTTAGYCGCRHFWSVATRAGAKLHISAAIRWEYISTFEHEH